MRGTRGFGIAAAVAGAVCLQARADVPCLLKAPGFSRERCASAECLSCHDGTVAPSRSHGHRVDVPYASSWLARRAALRAIPESGLVLASGRVTCATCHDGRSPGPHRLASPPGAQRLCDGCHDL